MPSSSMGKSFDDSKSSDPLLRYALDHTQRHPVQIALQEETLKLAASKMLGAPEVLALNTTFVRARRAVKCLDVGTFTGASALAAALGLDPNREGSEVVTMDVTDDHIDLARRHWAAAGVDRLVRFVKGPAAETMQRLIDDDAAAGTFDFAFVDADKTGYREYYEKCLVLLKPGGVVAFDNTLWSGGVLKNDNVSESTAAFKELNDFLVRDVERAFVMQLNVADGYTVAVKA